MPKDWETKASLCVFCALLRLTLSWWVSLRLTSGDAHENFFETDPIFAQFG